MMRISYYFFIILLCVARCLQAAEYLPLPKSLKNKPVYHHKVPHFHGFSCGYNTLFNFCKFEKNRFSDKHHFKRTVEHYLKNKRQRAAAPSNYKTLCSLAKQLRLNSCHYLWLDSKETLKVANERVYNKSFFPIPLTKPYVMHFICQCFLTDVEEDHAIAVTVMRDALGKKALHIFDNMNYGITEASDIFKHIKQLCKVFNI